MVTRTNLIRLKKLVLWLNTLIAMGVLLGVIFAYRPSESKILTLPDPTPIAVNLSGDALKQAGTYKSVLNNTPVFLYLPDTVFDPSYAKPVRVLVALHGINGSGELFGPNLLEFARQNQLVLIAPTFNYNQNWQNPQIVALEDAKLAAGLNAAIAELKQKIQPAHLANRLLIYGFSRGAQLAHRYALLYPQNTLGVAILSAGSYTLPLRQITLQNTTQELPFPFGISNLDSYRPGLFNHTQFQKITFLVEVGSLDNDPTQTPAAWDQFLGKGRVERARQFNNTLTRDGVNSRLVVVSGAGHTANLAMRSPALQFFKDLLVQTPVPSLSEVA